MIQALVPLGYCCLSSLAATNARLPFSDSTIHVDLHQCESYRSLQVSSISWVPACHKI